jgi:hypothetical protein
MHAHHEHRPAGELALHAVEEIQAASARHGKIEHRKIPLERACELERLVPVGRLADDDHGGIGFQHLTQPAPHDRVIVRNQYFHWQPILTARMRRRERVRVVAHRRKV